MDLFCIAMLCMDWFIDEYFKKNIHVYLGCLETSKGQKLKVMLNMCHTRTKQIPWNVSFIQQPHLDESQTNKMSLKY